MKKWNLTNLLMNNNDDNVNYGFTTTLEDGTEIQLYTSEQFINKVIYKYTSWCLSSPSYYDTEQNRLIDLVTNIEQATNMFLTMYQLWQDDKRSGFTKLYEALVSKYNPIWNVDGVTGTIYEDEHTGTDTNAKTGDDTSKLSGTDATASSGSDINTLSGRDVDTLSGTDTLRNTGTDSTLHSGTIADAHTGSITTAKNVTKDETTKTGNKVLQKDGPETVGHGVYTFDDNSGPKPSTVDETRYGNGMNDPRIDTETYNSIKDAHLYTDSITETHNNTDTTTHNNTDATTYGKNEATQYGKVDTMAYGKIDTLQHGKTDTTTYGKQDKMTYNSTNTETRDLYDKHIEMQIRQGNIGVTKTQELIESQIDLTARDSLIDYMIADFIHTNCIL